MFRELRGENPGGPLRETSVELHLFKKITTLPSTPCVTEPGLSVTLRKESVITIDSSYSLTGRVCSPKGVRFGLLLFAFVIHTEELRHVRKGRGSLRAKLTVGFHTPKGKLPVEIEAEKTYRTASLRRDCPASKCQKSKSKQPRC